MHKYDILVIGAGHAGLESAFATAKRGLKTGLITLSIDNVAKMPCNPSIGGPAKGVVTREIGALGGVQARAADECKIQIKVLGTSKGPGVWALRAQIDKVKYHEWFIDEINKTDNLDLLEGEVKQIIVENNQVVGLYLDDNFIETKSIVITSGTYLSSKTYQGNNIKDEGPDGTNYSKTLSHNLMDLGFDLIRLKTGTPARILKDSIDYSEMEKDYGSYDPLYFDPYHKKTKYTINPEPCYLLYTNQNTHKIIEDNILLSPMYSGLIKSIGPRYCPSIEDKIKKFPHRERHQLFIEPESLSLDTMYLGGFSTSMPVEIQDKMIRSLTGLKNCKIAKYGYAIEYYAIDPLQLFPSLMSKKINGLFFAGQVNGTSGYEEAAGQGIVAGINAANYVENKPMLILQRSNSYIGVMIDDLVTRGISEPYRLLTSRAEYRLFLRDDNVKERLCKIAYEQNMIDESIYLEFCKEQKIIAKLISFLQSKTVGQVKELKNKILKNNCTLYDFLKRPEVKLEDIISYIGFSESSLVDSELSKLIDIYIKFDGYIRLQNEKIEQFNRSDDLDLSKISDYSIIPNLPLEAIDKLNKIRPLTMQQARRISGINLEDILKIKYYLDLKHD
ncbi:MAG: tRNA uridine-5-carboxymethylaminomethyl(34) synthesis enzyme MnmG [Ureaplasma sp.]|nr:tRNA uridine-5-carboxymethylaminomethyl(34) synthesis enzyme MnmG [Ureaplasma sp.]MDE7221875.1 tRNA uridine-5-carboxymethylaminomethyl(34) synthesis enzyme MnmG [Ureaplasma sp.]